MRDVWGRVAEERVALAGPALELLLAMAGRAPSGDELAGDGVAALYSRTRTPADG
jgi:hypothetical protein